MEVWDADDFDPWEDLRWETVRVIFYRQHKPNGEVIEAFWLTDFPSRDVGSRALYYMAKSRWEIENQGFNEAKTLLILAFMALLRIRTPEQLQGHSPGELGVLLGLDRARRRRSSGRWRPATREPRTRGAR